MLVQTRLSELNGYLPERFVFAFCTSYEERTLCALRAISPTRLAKVIAFKHVDSDVDRSGVDEQVKEALQGVTTDPFPLKKEVPTYTADQIYTSLIAVARQKLPLVVDISTFTHESLLIFIAAIDAHRVLRDRTTLLYVFAEEYAINIADPARKWLSRGIRSVRPVLGFPGEVIPGRKTHLIALVGFDHDRIIQIWDDLEPEHFSVGITTTTLGDRGEIRKSTKLAAERIQERIPRSNVFEFDCGLPEGAAKAVKEVAARYPKSNIIIAPLNNKISTVGVGIGALKERSYQLCYAPALIYNAEGYSRASSNIAIFKFSDVAKNLASL